MPATDVFISSTCYDLGDLRAELKEYLQNHAFLVRMSEDYESEFEVNGRVDSIQSCLDNVAKADAVVCILDRRYGAPLTPPHANAPLSATHAEIAHACSLGTPVFTFIRDKTYIEADQILVNPTFKPRWIDQRSQREIALLVAGSKALAGPTTNNWIDQFKTSADLRPLVLKRLLDHFPTHVGTYARRPERLVRLYFRYRGNNAGGQTKGTFINAGNGPAIDVLCGFRSGGQDTKWHTQGGVTVGGELDGRNGGPLAFQCPPNCADLRIFREYGNASGDRFRVEVPLHWTANGYVTQGPEEFFAWIGSWIKVV